MKSISIVKFFWITVAVFYGFFISELKASYIDATTLWRPVVLMHGIKATNQTMDNVKMWIEAYFPGIYVKNVEIGDGWYDSIFMDLNNQLAIFTKEIMNDPHLAKGFNLIGYSQGGMVTRGYIERYNNPPVYNYITWSSPHGGQYGVPNEGDWKWLIDLILDDPYNTVIQDTISFSNFWKDPFNYNEYLEYSNYLADLNNERDTKNPDYKKNIISLKNFVMLYSVIDETIIPRESGWFEFYELNSNKTVIPLNESDFYTEDWLGIKTLDQNKQLHLFSCSVQHGDYPNRKDIFDKFTLPFLNNTLDDLFYY